jgi:iron only hydrogenase large subunit-like protein
MACKGGCVGGPGRILPPEEGTSRVNAYSDEAASHIPPENPQVYSILARLSHETGTPALTGEGPIATLLARTLDGG